MKNFKCYALLGLMLSSGAHAAAQNTGFVNIDEFSMHGTMNVNPDTNNGAYIRSSTQGAADYVVFDGKNEQGDEFFCQVGPFVGEGAELYKLAQDIAHGMTNNTEVYIEREKNEFDIWYCTVLVISKDTSYLD